MTSTPIPTGVLDRLWFYVNFDCTLHCSYCVAAPKPGVYRARLELPVFRRLVDQAVDLGFGQVALTGGEPFQHPDIAAMIEYATTRIDTVVLTNAVSVTARTLDGLRCADPDRLTFQVSLDSADPDVNDALRGRGSWRMATRGLELLVKIGCTVAVRATIDGQGEAALVGLTRLAGALGVPAERVYGAPLARVGRATHGLALSRACLRPEPTVVSDGLYWHPLLIEPATVVAPEIEPLGAALEALARMVQEVRPIRPKEVR